MKQIPLLQGKALLIELPEGARKTIAYGLDGNPPYINWMDNEGRLEEIALPPGNWRIIGMLSEMTEEQAATMVKECIDATECTTGYANYNRGDKPKPFCLDTALESLESAIRAEGYGFHSEPEPSYSDCEQYENPMRTYEGRLREWNSKQSRVLCRERCLVLRKI